jgi:hypothetical protein
MPRIRPVESHHIDALLLRDDRVATHAELVSLGMPASTITYRIRRGGPWARLLPGVIAAHSGVPTPHQRVVGAVKYAGEGAVVTGLTALRHYGFRSVPWAANVHVLTPHHRKRQSRDYVTVERTTRMPAAMVVRGIACAPVARAVLDGCRRLQDVDLVRALVAEAVQSQKCPLPELMDELLACSRPGSGLPRAVVREVSAGIRSVAEAKAKEQLQRAGVPQPEWNVTIEDSWGRWIADPDGYWESLGVALEIDSMTWHLSPDQYKRTQRRQRRMTSHGILVIPTAPGDIIEDPAEFVRQVQDTLRSAARRPIPEVRVRRPEAA